MNYAKDAFVFETGPTDGCMPILAGDSQMKSICCGWSPADAHANGAPGLQRVYVIEIAMTYGEKPLMCHALIRAVPADGLTECPRL